MTEAGREFYGHVVAMLERAEQAEVATRERATELKGTIRYTAAVATTEFAMSEIVPEFLTRHPQVNLIGCATDDFVDLVAQNYDLAIRAHSLPLPDSTLVLRTLAPAPWYLFGGAAYLDAHSAPRTPQELSEHPSPCS